MITKVIKKEEVLESPENNLIIRDDEHNVRTLTLNRPNKYNALNGSLIAELLYALKNAARDSKVHVIVLGAMGKAFSTGHDLGEVAAAGNTRNQSVCEAFFHETADLMTAIVQQPQPVIARVQGITTAAGCQLVASCDLAVASNSATFATSGINAGLFCMTPGVALSRNVANKHAFEMLTTGEFISAKRAVEIGLINKAVDPASLDDTVTTLAQTIAGKSFPAIKAGKAFFYKQLGLPLKEAYSLSAKKMAHNMTFKDAKEGIDAFLNKRKPVWQHK